MNETSYPDFILFNKMEEIKLKEYTKEDYYFAQLALITASANSDQKFTLQDFLIDFSVSEPISEVEKMKRSKSFWETLTGKKATFKE